MIVLIPARGGSKGLPGKNVKSFHGKPMIEHSISVAKKSSLVEDVFVSTDSEEIAEVARKAGAKVPFLRPPELAYDNSLAIDAYLHFIHYYQTNIKSLSELMILLPTSPLRAVEDIEKGIKLFYAKEADSVISCVKMNHPLSWVRDIDEKGKLTIPLESSMKNRQDEKVMYIPNGSIYIFKISILEKKQYYTDKTYALEMPRERSVDIDTELDFFLAEKFYERQNR
jgi:N-acylneuraminate cytidylyltransferase/CMP-N,N'-diacetyllegionaminic acid synthase